jgi:hypothetical protein
MTLSYENIPKIVPGTYGKAKIEYSLESRSFFLFYDDVKWMGVYDDFSDAFDNLYSQYEIAYGNVLITGLGFGILLKALEKKEEVTSITVLEQQQDVVDAFLMHNEIDKNKTKILIEDATTYHTDEKFDCFLPDHYEQQGFWWKVEDMNKLSKRINSDRFWPWSIEALFFKAMYPIAVYPESPEEIFTIYASEIYPKWEFFINKYFDGNTSLLSVPEDKVINYLTRPDWILISRSMMN